MRKFRLERISLGKLEGEESLDKLGKVTFKLRSPILEPHICDVIQEFSNEKKIIAGSCYNNKQSFLEEVDFILSRKDAYLTEAKYSNSLLGKKKVDGILYREKN